MRAISSISYLFLTVTLLVGQDAMVVLLMETGRSFPDFPDPK